MPKKYTGFTLIELLVVIAILATLAVMGFATFRGVSTKGNDARRQADLKAIGDVLEVKRRSPGGFATLDTKDFGSGTLPADPRDTPGNGGFLSRYCITYTTQSDSEDRIPIDPDPAEWAADTNTTAVGYEGCPPVDTGFGGMDPLSGDQDWEPIVFDPPGSQTIAVPASDSKAWKICALNENKDGVFCRNYAE